MKDFDGEVFWNKAKASAQVIEVTIGNWEDGSEDIISAFDTIADREVTHKFFYNDKDGSEYVECDISEIRIGLYYVKVFIDETGGCESTKSD